MQTNTRRYIGIVHRTKKTVDGDARPTMVAIWDNSKSRTIALETEQDELDFVLGMYPTAFRAVTQEDDLRKYAPHHIRYRKLKPSESKETLPTHLVRLSTEGTKKNPVYVVASKVPSHYDGLQTGDKVGMPLGGSGDNLAYAIVNRATKIGASLYRTPSFVLKEYREEAQIEESSSDSDDAQGDTKRSYAVHKTAHDHTLIVTLLRERLDLFYKVRPRDMALVRVRSLWRLLSDTMKDRIACEARLRKRSVGAMYTNKDGIFPEGGLEKEYAKRKASDVILNNLAREEDETLKELTEALRELDVYEKIFEPITGVGPKIAARIIATVADIRRFKTDHKFCAFMGVHVKSDGTFPRRTSGEIANWSTEGRQALYLLGEQFNRRPDSHWGKEFLRVKAELRKKHPTTIKAPQKLVRLYRAIERFFLRHNVVVPLTPEQATVDGATPAHVIETYDQLVEYFTRGVFILHEKDADNTLNISNVELVQTIERLHALLDKAENGWKSKSTTMYSAMHIHKMALWRTLNIFTRDLYKKWWELEGGKEATSEREAA